MRPSFAAVALSLGLCACAVVPDAPLAPLPADYAADARLGSVTMSSGTLQTPDAKFSDILNEEMSRGLNHCMNGRRRLDLRYHLTRYDDRQTRGADPHDDRTLATLSGRAELVDPRTRQVVGRFHVTVSTDERARPFDDGRGVARAFADDLCRQAFGRPAASYAPTRAEPFQP